MKERRMRNFEIDQPIETTFGNGVFIGYSNGGQTYKIRLTDGPNQGSELSFGEKAIISDGKNEPRIRKTESKYAPYEGNEAVFDAPVDFSRDGMEEFMQQANKWTAIIYSSPDSTERAIQELTEAGIENASDYVHPLSIDSHAITYNLFVPDPNIPDIDLKLGIYFNPIRLASLGLYQIARKEFVLKVLSKVKLLEVGEKL